MMDKKLLVDGGPMLEKVNRRYFLRSAGVAASLGAVVMGCTLDDHNIPVEAVNLGTGDVGILNYAYALEQLEAAFYTEVVKSFYAGASDEEKKILTDIKYHEIIHREFFKKALGSAAIKGLQPNFTAINFSNRDSVLNAAKTFEDLGVAAYNGAGNLIQLADYLIIAGKIVSVEARHAAAIRELLMPNTASFAGDDVVTPAGGLDLALKPKDVLPLAQPFVFDKIDGSGLPTM